MAILVEDTIEFFRELELNNNREWFEKNKKRYESSVKKPMEALAEQLIDAMRALDPEITMTPKQALFRIHRDIRFSKDKTPYKNHSGLSISKKGRADFGTPGIYLHVAPRNFGIASGYYHLEPDKLKLMRSFLASNLSEFQNRLNAADFRERFKTIAGEKNKILPPEFKEAAAKEPLLYNKQFFYWAEYEPEDALREDLVEFVMAHWNTASPMNQFLGAAFV